MMIMIIRNDRAHFYGLVTVSESDDLLITRACKRETVIIEPVVVMMVMAVRDHEVELINCCRVVFVAGDNLDVKDALFAFGRGSGKSHRHGIEG